MAEYLVGKVKGDSQLEVLVPNDPESHKVVPTAAIGSVASAWSETASASRLFGSERRYGIGGKEESFTQKDYPEQVIQQGFAGPLDGDRLFDVTIMNRSGEPVLLTAVGIEFLSVECEMLPMGGAMAGVEIELVRTFYVELPDLLGPASRGRAGRPAGAR